ncbi:transcriptional regulator [Methylorubrum populi]|uniref:transcriptional regulator n=1 Tax=Methylorubrum populi TaxID=223967 RepID=UPI003D15DFA5
MIRAAVRHLGSQGKLARSLGLSQARVSQLCSSVPRCSAEVALGVEKATASTIPAWHIRPDLFPHPPGGVLPPPGFYEVSEVA